MSDELKKHFLTDDDGTQYTTNLDRNRYGADNQYMFTGAQAVEDLSEVKCDCSD